MGKYEQDFTQEAYLEQEEQFEDLFDKAVLGEEDEEEQTNEHEGGGSQSSGGESVEESGGEEGTEETAGGRGSVSDASGSEEITDKTSQEDGEEERGAQDTSEEATQEIQETGEESEVDEDEEELLKDPKKLLQRYKTLQGMWRAQNKKTTPQEQPNEFDEDFTEQPVEKNQQQTKDQDAAQKIFEQLSKEDAELVEALLQQDDKFKELKEDFPEVAETMEAAMKKVVANLTVKQVQRMLAVINQNVAPFIQDYQQRVMQEHYQAIKQAHPDFEQYIEQGQLQAWINQQPPRKRKYYQEVYEAGSTAEVIDLLKEFKESLGLGGSKPKPKTNTQNKVGTMDEKKKKKMDDMEDISSRTRPVNAGRFEAPADDFELAFNEALKT